MLERLFLSHPRAVGENYLEHQKAAFGFASALFKAAFACVLHGLVPALCEKTGSTAVKTLHDRMITHRGKPATEQAQPKAEPWADYAI
jgi:hypothetical protein